MKKFAVLSLVAALVLPCLAAWGETPAADLRRAVPDDVYMAVYARHNPERDYQQAYWEEVWRTAEETKILERVVKIVTERAQPGDVEKVKAVLNEIREAAAPMDLAALRDCRETVYAQSMLVPSVPDMPVMTAEHLVLLRLTPEAAEGYYEGIGNLFRLAVKYAGDELKVETDKEGDADVTRLVLPKQVPFHPIVARAGDVVLFATSDDLAQRSLKLLAGGEGKSKFDDPRVAEALKHLPEFEDSIVFYDGNRQFSQMRGLGELIRKAAKDDPNAVRVAELIDRVFDELAVFDCEVSVEYTEGNQNRSASWGRLAVDGEEKVLVKVLGSGQPFESWSSWVPAGAVSYRLSIGANLHPLYDWAMKLAREKFPEVAPKLDEFEAWQTEHDFHIDRDLLQAFSGESVSVTLPAAGGSPMAGQQSVTALRCHKPERIRELLHRAMDLAKQQSALKAQMLDLQPVEGMEGFEQLSAAFLMMFQVRPVIGFDDEWMYLGSSAAAVQKVLDLRAGKGESIADTEAFKRFGIEIEGPVASLAYTDLAASTRNTAQALNQAGMIAPMVIGMAGANADPEAIAVVQQVVALLPDVAKIVQKFDFYQASLTVVQAGDRSGSYLKRSATLVRPAAEEKEEKTE